MSEERSTTCRACCPSCGLHFSGVDAFDRHLGGEANGWVHHHPLDVVARDGSPQFEVVAGECRMVPRDADGRALPPREVEVWRRTGSAERLAALRGTRGPGPVAQERFPVAGGVETPAPGGGAEARDA